ncbi:hypothetical protein ABK040_012451 [Willaertia magna]
MATSTTVSKLVSSRKLLVGVVSLLLVHLLAVTFVIIYFRKQQEKATLLTNQLNNKLNELNSEINLQINENKILKEDFKKKEEEYLKKVNEIEQGCNNNKKGSIPKKKVAFILTGAPRSLCSLTPFFYTHLVQPNIIYPTNLNEQIFYPSIFLCSVYKTKEELNCLNNFISKFNNNIIKKYYFEEYNENIIVNRFKTENEITINQDTIEPGFRMYFIQNNMTKGLLNYGSSLFLMHHCNELRKELELKENFKHDLIVRLRTDFLSEHNLPFINFNLNPNTLYLGNAMHFGGLNDHFGFGDDFTMNLYFKIYKELGNLAKEVGMHPETLLRHWMVTKNKIDVKIEAIYFQIIRDIVYRDHPTVNTWFRLPTNNLYEKDLIRENE